ncbi:MAG: hypothetical protein ACLR3C_05635 [Eggerthella lenta]
MLEVSNVKLPLDAGLPGAAAERSCARPPPRRSASRGATCARCGC